MAERMGQLGAVGLALESSWGVAAAAARYLEVNNADLRPVIGYEIPEVVRASRARRRVRGGSVIYSGPVNFEVSADGVGEILKAAFGTVTSTLVSSTASGSVYQHTFTRVESVSLPSLTVEQNLGGLTSKQITGVRINRLGLSVSPGAVLIADVDCRGRDETLITPTSPTYPTDEPLHHSGFAAQIGGASSGEVENFELRVVNNLVDDVWTAGAAGKLGKLPSGTFAVGGRFALGFESTSAYEAFKSGADTALQFKLTGATIVGTWKYDLQIDLPKVRYFTANVHLAPGRLVCDIEYEAILDASQNPPLDARVILQNRVSSY